MPKNLRTAIARFLPPSSLPLHVRCNYPVSKSVTKVLHFKSIYYIYLKIIRLSKSVLAAYKSGALHKQKVTLNGQNVHIVL